MGHCHPVSDDSPIYYDPAMPTSSDGEDNDTLPHRLDAMIAVRHLDTTNNERRGRRVRRRREVEEEDVLAAREHLETDQPQIRTVQAKPHLPNDRKDTNNIHIPGAFPDDSPTMLHSTPAVEQCYMQPTVADANEDENPVIRTPTLSSVPYPTLIAPLNPAFLVPAQPPSPMLPLESIPDHSLSVKDDRSMWEDYWIALDRDSEARAIKALREAGHLGTKRSRRQRVRREEQTNVVHNRNDVDQEWDRYLAGQDDFGPDPVELSFRNEEAGRYGIRHSRQVQHDRPPLHRRLPRPILIPKELKIPKAHEPFPLLERKPLSSLEVKHSGRWNDFAARRANTTSTAVNPSRAPTAARSRHDPNWNSLYNLSAGISSLTAGNLARVPSGAKSRRDPDWDSLYDLSTGSSRRG